MNGIKIWAKKLSIECLKVGKIKTVSTFIIITLYDSIAFSLR